MNLHHFIVHILQEFEKEQFLLRNSDFAFLHLTITFPGLRPLFVWEEEVGHIVFTTPPRISSGWKFVQGHVGEFMLCYLAQYTLYYKYCFRTLFPESMVYGCGAVCCTVPTLLYGPRPMWAVSGGGTVVLPMDFVVGCMRCLSPELLLSKEGYASLPMTLCQGGQQLEEIHVFTLSSNIQDEATLMVSVGVIVFLLDWQCWRCEVSGAVSWQQWKLLYCCNGWVSFSKEGWMWGCSLKTLLYVRTNVKVLFMFGWPGLHVGLFVYVHHVHHLVSHPPSFILAFVLFWFDWIELGWHVKTDHGLVPWLSCLHVIRVKISVTTAWGGFMHLASFIGSHVCAKSRLSPDWLLDFAPCDPSGCWPSV